MPGSSGHQPVIIIVDAFGAVWGTIVASLMAFTTVWGD